MAYHDAKKYVRIVLFGFVIYVVYAKKDYVS